MLYVVARVFWAVARALLQYVVARALLCCSGWVVARELLMVASVFWAVARVLLCSILGD